MATAKFYAQTPEKSARLWRRINTRILDEWRKLLLDDAGTLDAQVKEAVESRHGWADKRASEEE